MNDSFDDMYNNIDGVVQQAEQTPRPLISQQKISVSNLGKINKVNVDGNELVLVDHKWVEQLGKQIQHLESVNREQSHRLQRCTGMIQELQTRVSELEKNQSRLFNNDY